MLWKKANGSKGGAVKGNDLTAFIDEASEIEGKYTFSGTVMLNGRFTGEISSNDTLIIGEKGVVNATIRAGIVLVNGEVVGNILGGERVELRGSARVIGDVEAPVVVLEEGVLFQGHCRMTKPQIAADGTQRDHLRRRREGLPPCPDAVALAQVRRASGALGSSRDASRTLDVRTRRCTMDPIQLLQKRHREVEALFQKIEKTGVPSRGGP